MRRSHFMSSKRLLVQIFLLGLSPQVAAFLSPRTSVSISGRFGSQFKDCICQTTSLCSSKSESDHASQNNSKRTNFITPEQLNQLKDSVDIVSVVESYNLPQFSRKTHQTATAICPFHNDHSPSLNIDNQRKLFKCFACGEGGDTFAFVRAYSALRGKEMTFYESVRHVAENFGGPEITFATSSSGASRESEEDRQKRLALRNRILLCNAAAADFFGKTLMRLATAGPARTLLRTRGISPTTVRAFAFGYAPDAYFQTKVWGDGSLVHHLKALGFTAKEIVQAGLAKESKRPSWKDIAATEVAAEDDFENLMDRFRDRIIVPIFDESGTNVIAFGGRTVPVLGGKNVTTDFKPPKYLNSPESIVFSKKNELYALSSAKDEVERLKEAASASGAGSRSSIVIVEGYMDAISLYEKGIRNVVASMGTALSLDQLNKAAKTVGALGGRIVLCLDNDEAGIMAVERLCRSEYLAKTCETHVVEIVVATLPENVKDPGEFFESKLGDGDDFRKQVLESAIDWSTWYTQRILSRYDEDAIQGGPGSFANICERVSDFLATFKNPVDRTKRAYDVAALLSRTIAGNSSSNTLQIQLESDLVTMVSRKATAKEATERRVEAVEGYGAEKETVKRMLEGGLSQSALESSKLAANATASELPSIENQLEPKMRSFSSRGKRARMRRRGSYPKRESLTPHFTGVDILKSSDADWLGVSRDKSFKQLRGLSFRDKVDNEKKGKRIVLFNSNEYHGDQYLTEEASAAGYSKGEVKRDSRMKETGVGVLISEDQERKARSAEERILRVLAQYPTARAAMRAAVSSSDATGTRLEIDWSSEERSWLFDFLVFRSKEIPSGDSEIQDAEQLWDFLSTQEDAPVGAFATSPFEHSMPAALVANTEEDVNASPGVSKNDRMTAVDATVVNAEADESSPHVGSDRSDVEDWAASYDPSMFDEFVVPTDESVLKDLDSADNLEPPTTPTVEMKTDTVLDAKLESEAVSEEDSNRRLRSGGLQGTLDEFFIPIKDSFTDTEERETFQQSNRAELDVQEALAFLLRASAARKLNDVNGNWLLASRLLDARLGVEGAETGDVMSGVPELDSMEVGDLKLYCESLLTRLKQLCDTVLQLDESARRISTRLMEYCRDDTAEGVASVAKQEQVISEVEQFINDLPEDYVPPATDDLNLMDPMYVLSLYEQPGDGNAQSGGKSMNVPKQEVYDPDAEEAQFLRDMETIDEEWGGIGDDSYIWSMPEGDSSAGRPLPPQNNDDQDQYGADEPLEEALARIDEEWGDWEDESIGSFNKRGTPNDVEESYEERQSFDFAGQQASEFEAQDESSMEYASDSEWE